MDLIDCSKCRAGGVEHYYDYCCCWRILLQQQQPGEFFSVIMVSGYGQPSKTDPGSEGGTSVFVAVTSCVCVRVCVWIVPILCVLYHYCSKSAPIAIFFRPKWSVNHTLVAAPRLQRKPTNKVTLAPPEASSAFRPEERVYREKPLPVSVRRSRQGSIRTAERQNCFVEIKCPHGNNDHRMEPRARGERM